MHHCGADVHSKSTMLRILNGKGQEVFCGEVPTEREGLQGAVKPFIRKGIKVIQETGSSAAFVHDVFTEIGVEVVTVPASKMRVITQSKQKGDKRDAYMLAWHSYKDNLPEPVYIPTAKERDLRLLIAARERIRRGRTALSNGVRGQLKGAGIVLPGGALSRVCGWEKLMEMELTSSMRLVVDMSYEIWVKQTEALDRMEKEMEALTTDDDIVKRIRTIPGIGPASATAFRSYIGDPSRFRGRRSVVSYSGFCPSQRDSGQTHKRGRITKEGPPRLRSVFIQAANALITHRFAGHPGWSKWFERVLHKTGHRSKAVVALARRLYILAYHVARSGGVFIPPPADDPPVRAVKTRVPRMADTRAS